MIFEKNNWKLEIAHVLVKLGRVLGILSIFCLFHYFFLEDFENAKKVCFEALKIYKKKLIV
jgi:hypothetical protein